VLALLKATIAILEQPYNYKSDLELAQKYIIDTKNAMVDWWEAL
jgi:hypothetical protein